MHGCGTVRAAFVGHTVSVEGFDGRPWKEVAPCPSPAFGEKEGAAGLPASTALARAPGDTAGVQRRPARPTKNSPLFAF